MSNKTFDYNRYRVTVLEISSKAKMGSVIELDAIDAAHARRLALKEMGLESYVAIEVEEI